MTGIRQGKFDALHHQHPQGGHFLCYRSGGSAFFINSRSIFAAALVALSVLAILFSWTTPPPSHSHQAVIASPVVAETPSLNLTSTTAVKHAVDAAAGVVLPSYALAFNESFGYFDDITDENWKRYQQRARTEALYSNPHAVFDDLHGRQGAAWLYENVDPLFTCPQLRRVGGRGDGPKWMCDPHRLLQQKDCLIYSVGCGGVYVFEDAVYNLLGQNKHCEMHVFDMNSAYARPGDVEQKNIHFHGWALKSSSDTGAAAFVGTGTGDGSNSNPGEQYTLPEIMAKLNHTGRTIHVFKIDCEGCELSAYQELVSDAIDIRQVLMESHGLPRQTTPKAFFDAFLARGFVPYSKEANSYIGVEPPNQLFEWGFIRLHLNFLHG